MACLLLWSSAVRVNDSQAYRKMDVTRERISHILELREILLSFQTGSYLKAVISASVNMLPRCKLSTLDCRRAQAWLRMDFWTRRKCLDGSGSATLSLVPSRNAAWAQRMLKSDQSQDALVSP